jgi:hypothetical protein
LNQSIRISIFSSLLPGELPKPSTLQLTHLIATPNWKTSWYFRGVRIAQASFGRRLAGRFELAVLANLGDSLDDALTRVDNKQEERKPAVISLGMLQSTHFRQSLIHGLSLGRQKAFCMYLCGTNFFSG